VNEQPNPHQVVAADRLHICLLSIADGNARVTVVDLDGQTIDEFPLGQ
jgi:hypothetical protein